MDPGAPFHQAAVERGRKDYLDKLEQEAVRELIRVAVRRKLRDDIALGELNSIPSTLKMAVERYGAKYFLPAKKPSQSYFITISAKDGIDPKEFWRQMEKVIVKKGLEGTGEYSLEQRSEADQDPYGWHIHWILNAAEYVSKGVVAQRVYQCFMKYVASANYVHVEPIRPCPEDMARVKAYMSGHKKDEAKHPKVVRDQVLRQTLGLPAIQSY